MTTDPVTRRRWRLGRGRSSRAPSELLLIPGAQREAAAPWLPVALAGLVVVLQIAYPLLDGSALRIVTVGTVVAFASASVAHAWWHRGHAWAVGLLVVAGGLGLLVEVVGVRTGIPFGRYRYLGTLGPEVSGVPVVIPLAWTMMAYPAAVIASRIARSRTSAVLLAAWALAAWDFFLDPQMVAAGHWEWAQPGPSLAGIPVVNHLGWFVVALVIQALLVPSMPSSVDDRVPIALYVWTWLGSVVAHAVFLGLPLSAVTGGVAMGVVVLALAGSRRR